jgi:adenine-specific DNA methylase
MMGKKLHDAPEVYADAKAEMVKHCDGQLPAIFDPFAGGGSIPLEANRLGFEANASDLNPVAVLLNKCNLEFAPRWAEFSCSSFNDVTTPFRLSKTLPARPASVLNFEIEKFGRHRVADPEGSARLQLRSRNGKAIAERN